MTTAGSHFGHSIDFFRVNLKNGIRPLCLPNLSGCCRLRPCQLDKWVISFILPPSSVWAQLTLALCILLVFVLTNRLGDDLSSIQSNV